MKWTLLLSTCLLLAPATGCMEQQGGDGETAYEVSWETEPTDASVDETIEASWRLDGPDGEVPHTGVHYATESVEDPQTPADYGNTSGASEPAQVPASYDVELTFDEPGTYYVRAHAIVGEDEHRWSEEVQIQIEAAEDGGSDVEVSISSHTGNATEDEGVSFTWQLDGGADQVEETSLLWGPEASEDPRPGDYPNRSGTVEDAAVPGTYEVTLTGVEPGVYHARAHAVLDGADRWSGEVRFNVTEVADEPESETHEVAIEGFAFEPAELTVRPGDEITWENRDAATHTVTFADEALDDSGDVESGETYTLVVPDDAEPGTYDYTCDYHATMEASLTVEAPDGG